MRTKRALTKAATRAYEIIRQLEADGLAGPSFTSPKEAVNTVIDFYDRMLEDPEVTHIESGRLRLDRDEPGDRWFSLYVNVDGND